MSVVRLTFSNNENLIFHNAMQNMMDVIIYLLAEFNSPDNGVVGDCVLESLSLFIILMLTDDAELELDSRELSRCTSFRTSTEPGASNGMLFALIEFSPESFCE